MLTLDKFPHLHRVSDLGQQIIHIVAQPRDEHANDIPWLNITTRSDVRCDLVKETKNNFQIKRRFGRAKFHDVVVDHLSELSKDSKLGSADRSLRTATHANSDVCSLAN